MMTRKDYRLIADVLVRVKDSGDVSAESVAMVDALAILLGEEFERANSRYDSGMFLSYVGIEPQTLR
jgi:hypothetical protein